MEKRRFLMSCTRSVGLAVVPVACLLLLLGVARMRELVNNPFGFSTRVTPSGPVVLQQVQSLRRLETCRYNGQAVVRGETMGSLPAWLAGDKLVFIGHGEVVGGVDLEQMQAGDVQVEGAKVTLKLPPAQILHARLDNNTSEVFERQTGLFTKADPDLETKVRREAEERIRQAALESGLLATATENARSALRAQLKQLGFREIFVS